MFLFRLLSTFDYISPIANTVDEMVHGVGRPVILKDQRQLEHAVRLLEHNGIDVWCAERFSPLVSDVAGLRIAPDDYERASKLLSLAGIRIRTPGGWD